MISGWLRLRSFPECGILLAATAALVWKYDFALPHPTGALITPMVHVGNLVPLGLVCALAAFLHSRWSASYEIALSARSQVVPRALAVAGVTVALAASTLGLHAQGAIPTLTVLVAVHASLGLGLLLAGTALLPHRLGWATAVAVLVTGAAISAGWFPSLYPVTGNATGTGLPLATAALEAAVGIAGAGLFVAASPGAAPAHRKAAHPLAGRAAFSVVRSPGRDPRWPSGPSR